MSEWTDELKQELIEAYTGANPTPENTMDIVKELADKYDKTPNGVRIILNKAGVYVKKEAATASKASSEDKPKRVSKADAIDKLTTAISASGAEVDEAIISKLTGKAALYFANIIEGMNT